MTHQRICFERVVPAEWTPPHLPARASMPTAGLVAETERMAVLSAKVWPTGSALRCRFLHGTPLQRRLVEQMARLWEEHANVSFSFGTTGTGDIRIAFLPGQGSWSAVGTDALCHEYFPKHQPTINFGWLEDDTPEEEYQRVVLHEFGHALGCIHEHQSPSADLQWVEEKVYEVYAGPPNFWSKEQTYRNILRRYQREATVAGSFDPLSIMLYQFDSQLFNDNIGTSLNHGLSEGDKELISRLYPFSQ